MMKFGAIKPDLVIFFDGLNERGTIAIFQEMMNNVFNNISNPYFNWSFSEKFKPLYGLVDELAKQFPRTNDRGLDLGEFEYSEYNLPPIKLSMIFKSNLLTRDIICKKYSLDCVTFLQPHPGEKSIHSLQSEKSRQKYINKFKILQSVDHDYVDFTGALEKYNKHAYVDNVHYSPKASEIIADKIVGYIKANR